MAAPTLRAVRSNAGDLLSMGLSPVHGHGKEDCAPERKKERKKENFGG
jgi:hypothetical protein